MSEELYPFTYLTVGAALVLLGAIFPIFIPKWRMSGLSMMYMGGILVVFELFIKFYQLNFTDRWEVADD